MSKNGSEKLILSYKISGPELILIPLFAWSPFFSQVFRGKGQLSTIVSDPIEDKKCEIPAAVLSNSQVNALAVSVFVPSI